jgi:predicted alpha/beta-fold hydrolase
MCSSFNKESIYDYYEEASSVEQLREIVESLKNSKTK